MKNIAVKLADVLIELLDELVEERKYPNRSTAIRYAIVDFLRREGKL